MLDREMAIPKKRAEVIIQFVMTIIVVGFAGLAIVNLCNKVALIPSLIWLALVITMVRSFSRREGGLRMFLISQLGDLFGRRFVGWEAAGAQGNHIRFGFYLFNHRFVQKCIPIDKIESVEWSTGQATAMAGRDMNDWSVWVWFDHNDPVRTEERRKWHRKPEQDLYGVGPAGPKGRAEALGLSFISLLRSAGADLIQHGATIWFARKAGAETKASCHDQRWTPRRRSV